MKTGVLSLVNDAHTAAAELFDDAVVRDGLADHGNGRRDAIMVGGRALQVNCAWAQWCFALLAKILTTEDTKARRKTSGSEAATSSYNPQRTFQPLQL